MKSRSREIRHIITARNMAWMLIVSALCGAIILISMTGTDILVSLLLLFSGKPAITSGNINTFFRSWHGYAVLAITELILLLTGAALLNTVILLAEDLRQGKPVYPGRLILRSFRRIRLFLCRQGIPVIVFYLFFIPAISITAFFIIPNPFEFPGFMLHMIRKKLLYRVLYILSMAILLILQMRSLFLLHEAVLEKETLPEARKRAHSLVREHRPQIYPSLLGSLVLSAVLVLAGLGIFRGLPLALSVLFRFLPRLVARYITLFGTLIGLLIFALCVLLAPWIIAMTMAGLYDRLCGRDTELPEGKQIPAQSQTKPGHPWRVLISLLVCLAAAAVLAGFGLVHFEYLFPRARMIEAVVHRLGGDLDIENTLEGQEAALELGAEAAETDIQRTKDGEYIIFHDGTLKRLCGRNERPCDLTLEELRSIEMTTLTGEIRHIPTLEEVLDTAKGREKLYLELKGVTVDEQMADDVIAMVMEKDMLEDCVLISMNYNVIRYIYRNYPDVRCGYLYFFAYGYSSRLEADLIMSQSNVINPAKTRAIHRAGKRLYCWTVNSRSGAKTMIRRRVDGIISDRYDIIASVLDHMESRTDYERIMDVLVN